MVNLGVLLYNTINDDNTCKHLGNIEATNLVLQAILILTNEGYKRIDECDKGNKLSGMGFEWSVVTPCYWMIKR